MKFQQFSNFFITTSFIFVVGSFPSFLEAKKIKVGGSNGKNKNLDVSELGPPGQSFKDLDQIEVDFGGNGNGSIKKFKRWGSTGKTWKGGDEHGETITLLRSGGRDGTDDVLVGSILDPKEKIVHQIYRNADGTTIIASTPAGDFPPEKDGIHLDGNIFENRMLSVEESIRSSFRGIASSSSGSTRKLQTGPSIIRVLVPWTEAAECAASGLASGCVVSTTTENTMEALVQLAIEETNDAYTLSGIDAQLVLAYAYRDPDNYIEYAGTRDPFTNALYDIQGKSDGKLDAAHTLRETYGADAVALLIHDPTYCGIGFYTPSPSANTMFSVTSWSCATGNYSFGHELGHNMGCKHDRGAQNECSVTGATNYGFRDTDGEFRSIMAYNCRTTQCDSNPSNFCMRVQRFSHPGDYVTTGGVNMGPIGNAQNNCAGQINSVVTTVANFYSIPTCGNGDINDGEQCDGINLNGQTCETLGVGSGILGCSTDCSFDTSLCGAVPTAPIDILFIVDTSGSYKDDLPIFKAEAPTMLSNLQSANSDSRFGLVSFEDYPQKPWGNPDRGDEPYRKHLDFTFDLASMTTEINNLSTRSGWDKKESQLTAIYESIAGVDALTFRPNAIKIIMLWTDAPFHRSEEEPGYPGPTTYEVFNALDSLLARRRRVLVDEPCEGCVLPLPASWPVRFIGVEREAKRDVLESMAELAMYTDSFAGTSGIDCDGDGVPDLAEGEPIVCPGISGESLGLAIETIITETVETMAPVAKCKDVLLSMDPGQCYSTSIDVDNGSYDPNEDPSVVFEVFQSPSSSSQFGLGLTNVNLVAVNSYGLTDTCTATVIITDDEEPVLDCNLPPLIRPNDSPIWIDPQASDNCGIQSIVSRNVSCFKLNKNGKKTNVPCRNTMGNNGSFRIDNTGGVGTHWQWTVEATDVNSNVHSKVCELTIGNGN